jgi:K+-transporting ATPase KdpF subunit
MDKGALRGANGEKSVDIVYVLVIMGLLLTALALVAGCCGLGAQEMTWAYALSGAVAVALAVYLVWALIRAEEL